MDRYSLCVTIDDWRQWIETGVSRLPMVVEAPWTGSLPSWASFCSSEGAPFCVLESAKDGRYTFVTAQCEPGLSMYVETNERDVLQEVREWQQQEAGTVAPRKRGWPPFMGGVIGYVSYDVARTIEVIPAKNNRAHALPDVWFVRVDSFWAVDHERGRLFCVHHLPTEQISQYANLDEAYVATVAVIKQRYDQWCHAVPPRVVAQRERVSWSECVVSRESFRQTVEMIQEAIRSGDTYQVNISIHQSTPLDGAPLVVYEQLRQTNPSPYMAFVQLNARQAIVSASPECLVSCVDGLVTTRPIAGTRPRGRDEQEDEQYAAQVRSCEKQCAEHVMLVDLERHDVGKIAQYGTVAVPQLMVVERYSHVMHLVSTVTGRVRENCDAVAILRAMFPGGTITGAPKAKTMEWIERLEPVRRGVYTGSLGWIDDSGNMAFNILIRTIVCDDDVAHVHAGAGIVLDSDAEDEYDEIRHKAMALWQAIAVAHSRSDASTTEGGVSR